ncbi:MAG: peptidylprolyl isomerase [Verrucomicrobiae bacterium]|nr:peptidylprolyl isomerase [Verrucomicrobiae bacterium]NNJ87568.1 peptidylprolyl isomerase [Akkermansiaceae bacterium]
MELSRAALIAEVRTSLGNFSIDLNYTGARRTVSHFMRLAKGEQPWLDEKTGQIRSGVPFYNGLKFYKKEGSAASIPKYIQAGARYPDDPAVFISNEKQGAGYVIRDEIRHYAGTSTLVVPHGLYTVSMANTGPHSSSSQFFINLVNDTWWNERNSAFGVVQQQFIEYPENGSPYVSYNGRDVVNAIHAASQNVTIYSVKFRITNNTPTEFDSSEQATELPVFYNRQISSLMHTPTNVVLNYDSVVPASETRVWFSLNLFNWSPFPSATTYASAGAAPVITFNHGGARQLFLRSTMAAYPVSTVPDSLDGEIIRIALGKPYAQPQTNVVQLYFDPNGLEHTYYSYTSQSWGTFVYSLLQGGPYHGDMEVTYDGSENVTYQLYFGGANQWVTEDEQMRAIINPDASAPIEARWYYQ